LGGHQITRLCERSPPFEVLDTRMYLNYREINLWVVWVGVGWCVLCGFACGLCDDLATLSKTLFIKEPSMRKLMVVVVPEGSNLHLDEISEHRPGTQVLVPGRND
jgi:hypothetical protein